MNRRLIVPLTAAVAVLVVLALVWWATSGDDGSGGTAGPPASSPSAATAPVPVESYFPRSEKVLALNYSIGVPACYGTLGKPEVTESADAVVVQLHRVEPPQASGVSCIQTVEMKSVDVTLAEPLDGRVVKDGDRVVPRADAAYGASGEDPSY